MKKLFATIPCLQSERLTLRALTPDDAEGLRALTDSPEVYRYLPSFLFEKKYDDPLTVIERLYDECLKESLILGIFLGSAFCGLIEVYGYRAPLLKASVGYRLPEYWGQGIATEALGRMVGFLLHETDVRILTASVIPENEASAHVLGKCGFRRVLLGIYENWGYPLPTKADKWIKTADDFKAYRFHA